MKKLVSVVVAVGLAAAFASPVLATTKVPTSKAACEKAKMSWDDSAKKCSKSSMYFAGSLDNRGASASAGALTIASSKRS